VSSQRAPDLFLLGFRGTKNKREKENGTTVRERNRETTHHLVPTKKKFVFLSFILHSSFGNNLHCVVVRFGYIVDMGSE
jgi:hypothetical protein